MKKHFLMAVLLFQGTLYAWTHLGSNLRGWNTQTLRVSVNTESCTLPAATVLEIVDEALAAWNGIPYANLKLERGSSTSSIATILAGTATDAPVIACDPDFETHIGSSDAVPGVTFRVTPNAAGNIAYAGMLLNAEAGAGAEISQLTRDELAIVIAHELGHALGLGHSSNEKALMYYSIANKSKAQIAQDDMDGIAHLYPRNELSGKGMAGCSAVHEPGKLSKKSAASTLLFFILFLGLTLSFGKYFAKYFVRLEQPL
jgi:hypothetical protein